MKKINITINEIQLSVPEKTTLKDIINEFFCSRCEFIININSEFIKNKEQKLILLQDNDKIRIVSYSRHNYQRQKRTVFNDERNKIK